LLLQGLIEAHRALAASVEGTQVPV